jgi:hypothetical protein
MELMLVKIQKYYFEVANLALEDIREEIKLDRESLIEYFPV